jgi:hypothetical protein
MRSFLGKKRIKLPRGEKYLECFQFFGTKIQGVNFVQIESSLYC